MKTIKQHLNYTPKQSAMQVMLPLDLGLKIGIEESVRLLIEVTERMDYTRLDAAYDRKPRSNEATPKQMFQIIVYGFMKGVYSTRALEEACRNDIRFMYLLGDKKIPDHSRFASFIQKRLNDNVAENLFYQFIKQLQEMGEISFENIFVDGTKIEANANRYSFVWAKSTDKYDAKLKAKIGALLENLKLSYLFPLQDKTTITEVLLALQQEAKKQNIQFVQGRGKRKTQLQRDIELLSSYLSRQQKYDNYKGIFKGRNSFSKTDKDATFMRMKEDHMRNGQLKPAYNLQLGVEGEYIVGIDISCERSDELTLLNLLNKVKNGCGKYHKNVVADAGYESEENYKSVLKNGQIPYIKPQNYERSKKRKYKNNIFLRENMPYNDKDDTYTCPAGNKFVALYNTIRRSKSKFESTVTVYGCLGCNDCSLKSKCTRAKGNRKISVSKDFATLRKQTLDRLQSDTGKLLRLNRSIQSEGVFGVIKQDYGIRRFLRRGNENVFTETVLYSLGFNINKLYNKRMQNRLGVMLHKLKAA